MTNVFILYITSAGLLYLLPFALLYSFPNTFHEGADVVQWNSKKNKNSKTVISIWNSDIINYLSKYRNWYYSQIYWSIKGFSWTILLGFVLFIYLLLQWIIIFSQSKICYWRQAGASHIWNSLYSIYKFIIKNNI